MARNQKDATFDFDLRLKDAHLVAAHDPAQVGGADQILDLGADARMDGRVIVDITAIEVASNDERYLIFAQFSSASDFSTGVVSGAGIQVGAAEITDETVDTPVGRYEFGVTNEYNGTLYRYMRLRTQVEGTIATGINFSANLHRSVR